MPNTYVQLSSAQTWVSLLPSASRTVTPNPQQVDIKMTGLGGLMLVVNVTVAPTSGNVTAKIEGVDPVSQATWPILIATGTAIINSTNGAKTYVYKMHPAAPSTSSAGPQIQHAQDVVPPIVRFTLTHDVGATATYSATMLTDGD